MKLQTIRKRVRNMRDRALRDAEALEAMFPRTDWNAGDDATEALRNFHSTVAWLNGLLALSDTGMRRAIDAHTDT